MAKLAPEWVRTSDPVIRSPARYRWTTAPAPEACENVLTVVAVPIKKMACFPPTPKYEISLFSDLGALYRRDPEEGSVLAGSPLLLSSINNSFSWKNLSATK